MPKYEVLRHITRNRIAHEIGSFLDLTAKEAETLPVRLVAEIEKKIEGKKAKEAEK